MGSGKIQGDLWGRSPSGWAQLQEPQHSPLFEAMLDAANVSTNTRLLDAGCGGGSASVLASGRGAQVSGLDAAEGLIAIARERVPSGDFRVGDLQQLPFGDDSFDAVIAPNSVQYAEDRVAALRELGRVCTPQGRIVVGLFATPEKVTYSGILKAVVDAMPEPPPGDGPFGLSAPGKLEELIEEAGLTILESKEVDCPFSYPDFETFWQASASAGPFQGVMRALGEEWLRAVLRKAVKAYESDDGRIEIAPNFFKYIVAVV